jgi:hypothetical protein
MKAVIAVDSIAVQAVWMGWTGWKEVVCMGRRWCVKANPYRPV